MYVVNISPCVNNNTRRMLLKHIQRIRDTQKNYFLWSRECVHFEDDR